MTEPYRETAWTYRAAGWVGVLPLPVGAKTPPPLGFTGWAGVDPSGADVQAWIDDGLGDGWPAGNIALRLGSGLYGLDVDDYGGKTGASALERLVEQFGPLPPTWILSSREASASGIRLFRAELPPGRRWRDEPAGHGAGIEAIHRGHRYAVTWPSVHPDTGRKYTFRRPDGIVADGEVPRPDDLPLLPEVWVMGLSEPGEARIGDMAGHEETVERVTGWREGPPCPRVRVAHERALGGLSAAVAGAALHPAAVAALFELTNLGHEGHVGVRRALAEHYAAFIEVRRARSATADGHASAGGEWWRMVRGAIGKLPAGAGREVCDCDLWAGVGVQFDPWPGPNGGSAGTGPGLGPEVGPVVLDGPLDLADALLARMIGPAELRDRPGPAWLVDGLLTLDSASWLIAAPSSYKSFVALDWAGHVAAGRPWMGRTTACGPVVYVVAEGVGGMGPRIRAWEQRHGPMSPAVRFLPMPIQIGRADHWAALVEACRRLAPVLVILDTQARITVGLDENDNTAMGEVVEAIEQLRRACGACVLTVHHTGRSGQNARGASAIDGAQDMELKLTRTADLRVVLECDKSKHSSDDLRVDLELFLCELDGGGTSLVVGEPLGSPVALLPWREGLTDNEAAIAEILHELYSDQGGTRADVRTALRERGQRGQARYVKSTFDYAWNQLCKKDRIARLDGTQRFVLARPEEGRH